MADGGRSDCRIALDAMGGDHAPDEVLKGAEDQEVTGGKDDPLAQRPGRRGHPVERLYRRMDDLSGTSLFA